MQCSYRCPGPLRALACGSLVTGTEQAISYLCASSLCPLFIRTGWNYCLDSLGEDRHCKQPWPSPLQELKQTEPAAQEGINFQTHTFNCRESTNKGGGCTGENIPTQQNAKERHTNRPGSTLAQRVPETSVPRVAEMFVCSRGLSLNSKGQFR